ncbi:MAG: serine/threonine-protein kinase, partial [Myxococcota bacterium]
MTASSPDEWSTEQPELPVEEQLPRAFGRYLLLARIAQGGMGELYLARRGDLDDEHRDDLHVVKKLRAEHTRDREYVARFVDEARLVVQLSHPNICQVVDVGRVKDEYFLTMEYIAGRDVRDLQTRLRDDGGTLETGDALLIVSDVLKALEYAHHRTHAATGELLHLVHRDVSPQNVMVSFTGEVKLIDFGLASSRLKLERTQPNVVMGKMAYMSPEQARGDTIDKRTDVFAAGVLAYELLVGERFYETMTSHEIWNVVGRGGFRPRHWEHLDERVAEVLSRALEADIALRYPSAGDFRADLDALLHASFGGRNEERLGRFMRGVYGADVRRERALVRGFDALRGSVVRDLLEGTSPHGISLASSMERPAVHRQGDESTPGQE